MQQPRTRETQRPTAEAVGTADAGLGLQVGASAPDVNAQGLDGSPVRLASLWSDSDVLVVFYRGGWCPYCNFQVRELAEAWPAFQQRGVRPVLVSVDRVEEAARTQASWEVPFPVLSDPDLVAHEAFRVVYAADDAEVERLAKVGLDVEGASGRTHHKFAVPSLFYVESPGVIRWVHIERDYKTRPSPEQILAAIDAARASADDAGRP
jgi:peroxiredoxin